LTPDKGTL